MADEQGRTFEDVHERLSEIVDEVSAEDISLDDALKLYEEAVKLGLSACDLSEQDLDAFSGDGRGNDGRGGRRKRYPYGFNRHAPRGLKETAHGCPAHTRCYQLAGHLKVLDNEELAI